MKRRLLSCALCDLILRGGSRYVVTSECCAFGKWSLSRVSQVPCAIKTQHERFVRCRKNLVFKTAMTTIHFESSLSATIWCMDSSQVGTRVRRSHQFALISFRCQRKRNAKSSHAPRLKNQKVHFESCFRVGHMETPTSAVARQRKSERACGRHGLCCTTPTTITVHR